MVRERLVEVPTREMNNTRKGSPVVLVERPYSNPEGGKNEIKEMS